MTDMKKNMEKMRASNSAFAASVTKHHKTVSLRSSFEL